MFCGKCGNNVPDGAVVCPACGAPTGAAPAPGGAKKPSKKLIAGIVGVVAVIALVIILITSCGGGNPESMTEDLMDALFGGSGEDVWDAINMDAYLDISVGAGDIDEDRKDDNKDRIIENFDSFCEFMQDRCEKSFGKDWSYEVEVTKVKDLKNSDLRDFEDAINGDDSDFEVTEGVSVSLKVSVSSDDDNEVLRPTFEFYKVDGDWIINPFNIYSLLNDLYCFRFY